MAAPCRWSGPSRKSTVREVINAEGKRAIGRLAASLVPDGATVILASGSTVQSVADALQSHQRPDGLHQQHLQLHAS